MLKYVYKNQIKKNKDYLNLIMFIYYNTKIVFNIVPDGRSNQEILNKFLEYYPNSNIKLLYLGLILKMIYGQNLKKYGSCPTYYNIKILC